MPNPVPDPHEPQPTSDNPGSLVGDDATATFDNGPSNPTDRASSEALHSATAVHRDSTTAQDEDMHALHMEDAADEEDQAH